MPFAIMRQGFKRVYRGSGTSLTGAILATHQARCSVGLGQPEKSRAEAKLLSI